MGCIPSSTYPEHIPRSAATPAIHRSPSNMSFGEHVSRNVSSGAFTRAATDRGRSNNSFQKSGSNSRLSPHYSPFESPPLRLESRGDVAADGVGLASTTYITTNGKKYRFLYGRPAGFSGAEDIISCLDDVGMRGNLYRLVRSKLVSIGEEEVSPTDAATAAAAAAAGGQEHADTLSESEAKEREQGMDVLACSVTARRSTRARTAEAALQEQYVVALLGTDVILDTSAIAPSRRRPRIAQAQAKGKAKTNSAIHAHSGSKDNDTNNSPNTNPNHHTTSSGSKNQKANNDSSHITQDGRLSATQRPSSVSSGDAAASSSSSASSSSNRKSSPVNSRHSGPSNDAKAAVTGADFGFDWDDDQDYQLFPQDHYSALPAQRKPGAAVPIALCPPSRTLRVPVQFSAVENRVVAAPTSKHGEKGKSWTDKVNPQRMFRLATSETRTWAFYNDSEYVMHVYALFDRASKLEPRDSTRLWASSVFDEGNEAPSPPPVFFGLFFDEEGEEVVPTSEMPDSANRQRQQRIFGSRGMWIAELLVPPRSTRMFVEGKIRGAYRMRCTRLELDDLVAATETASAVARKRNTKHAPERFPFSLRRGSRASATKATSSTAPPSTLSTSQTAATTTGASASRSLPGVRVASSDEADQASRATPSPPHNSAPPESGTTAAASSAEQQQSASSTPSPPAPPSSSAPLAQPPSAAAAALLSSPPKSSSCDVGCHSTLTESQGVLTRQTYIRHPPAPPSFNVTVPPTTCPRAAPLRVPTPNPLAPLRDAAQPGSPKTIGQPPLPPLAPAARKPSDAAAAPAVLVPTAAVREVVPVSSADGGGLRALPRTSDAAELTSSDLAATGSSQVSATQAMLLRKSLPPDNPRYPVEPKASRDMSISDVGRNVTWAQLKDMYHLAGPDSQHDIFSDPAAADNTATTTASGNGAVAARARSASDAPSSSRRTSLATDTLNNSKSNAADRDTDFDSVYDTQDSCAEFARVRPGRQRTASVRDDVLLFSDSPAPTSQLSAVDHGHLPPRALDSTGVSPLGQAALPLFTAQASTSTLHCEEARQRKSAVRRSRASPRAPDMLSPHFQRRHPSGLPLGAGVAAASSEDKSLCPESVNTLTGTSWHPKVHTLTPQSSYQSERFRRTVPSMSSCRTVAVDDSASSFTADGDAPAHESPAERVGHTIPFQREVRPSEQTGEL